MQRAIVITLLVAFATSSMIVLAQGDAIVNLYESLLKDSQGHKSNNHACVDFYSMTCNKINNNIIYQPKYKDQLAELYSSQVYNILIDILNDEVENEKHPIYLERNLFQSCMRLDNQDVNHEDHEDDNDNKIKTSSVNSDRDKASRENTDDTKINTMQYFFDGILKSFNQEIDEENWQKLDQKLALLGFKHSFFEIDVVKDPDAPNKNIIRLSPPSMKEWNFKKLTDVVSDIFTQMQLDNLSYCKKDESSDDTESKNNSAQPDNDSAFWESNENEINESDDDKKKSIAESTEVPAICAKLLENPESLTTQLVDDDDQEVMNLLNEVLQGIFDTMDTSNKDSKVKRFTIEDWNSEYRKSVKDKTAKIDWSHVLKSYFKNSGIHVENKDYILVENLPYFHKMAKFFNRATNEIIAHALRSKFIGENMRYWAWDYVYEINPMDKTAFCLEQNQFYAASAEVLKRLELKMKPYNIKVESVLYNIASVLHSNISDAKLSETEKSYVLSNLKDFTKNPFEIVEDPILSEYYKDFEITGKYLVDINHYKSLMRKMNLQKLRDDSMYDSRKNYRSSPFSVLEIENPRNRYIINSALNAIIYKDKFLGNKAAVYSTFGVKSASFLFSLLAEKSYENDLRDFRGILSITPRVSYSPEYVSCFLQESSVKYGYPVVYDIITEVFSIRFAYEALLQHVKAESTEEFFTAYTEDHCGENDRQMIKKILSNIVEFSNAFECLRNENTVCHLKAF